MVSMQAKVILAIIPLLGDKKNIRPGEKSRENHMGVRKIVDLLKIFGKT